MCNHIHPNIVFSEFAIEIRNYDDIMFVGFIIETLDLILAGSDDYKSLRDILGRKNDDREKQVFFKTLFQTWWFKNFSGTKCINPISSLTLCLTSRKYKLAFELLLWICKKISLTKDNMIQLWNLVQLIESPTFMRLRVDLLDPHKNYYLVKTLQGILMMMPIWRAFNALKIRLECIKLDPKYKLLWKKPLPPPDELEDKEINDFISLLVTNIEKSHTSINNSIISS